MNLRCFLLTGFLSGMFVVAQPSITGFDPPSGVIGSTVTLTGTNFNPVPANNAVYFGATRADVNSASATILTVTVPVGATLEWITVTNLTTQLTGYSSKPYIVTFPNCGPIDSANFELTLEADLYPYCFYPGYQDIDGDGKGDLAVPSFNTTDSITIYKNTSTPGLINFERDVSYYADMIATAVLEDLDGDGKPELVINHPFNNNLAVQKNSSTGGSAAFDSPLFLTTQYAPQSFTIHDFDGDGWPDIAAANTNSHSVSVFRNISTPGTLAFAPKVDIPLTAGSTPYFIVSADIDGDIKPDLVVCNSALASLGVLLNNSSPGSISFLSPVDFSSGSNALSLTFADYNSDGKTDLAAACNDGMIVRINASTPGAVLFDPLLSFNVSIPGYQASVTPSRLQSTDFNGDGRIDIVCSSSHTPSTVSFFENIAGPTVFSTEETFTTGILEGQHQGVVAGDVDGDGAPDVTLVVAGDIDNLKVLRNLCNPGLGQPEEEDELPGITVYPNPSTGDITITTRLNVHEGSLVLIDCSGNVLKSITCGADPMIFRTQDLCPGIYFIRLSDENGFVETRKLIVQ
jgi:hypothetical protein